MEDTIAALRGLLSSPSRDHFGELLTLYNNWQLDHPEEADTHQVYIDTHLSQWESQLRYTHLVSVDDIANKLHALRFCHRLRCLSMRMDGRVRRVLKSAEMKQLRSFTLDSEPNTFDRLSELTEGWSDLRELSLRNTYLDQGEWRALMSNQTLKKLESLLLFRTNINWHAYEALFMSAEPPALQKLQVYGENDGSPIDALIECERELSLTELALHDCQQIDGQGLFRLAHTKATRGLHTLTLQHIMNEPVACEVLSQSPILEQLRSLSLLTYATNASDLTQLCETERARSLKTLKLNTNYIDLEGTEQLVQSPFLTELRHLDLIYCRLPVEALPPLISSELFTHLWHLNLSHNYLGNEGVSLLKECQPAQLKHLSLVSIHSEAGAASELSQAPLLSTLESLSIGTTLMNNTQGTRTDRKGLLDLLHSPHLTGLRCLRLTGYEEQALTALTEASTWSMKLEELTIDSTRVDDQALSRMLRSPNMKHIHTLRLRRAGDQTLRALIESAHLSALRDLRIHDLSVGQAPWRDFCHSSRCKQLDAITPGQLQIATGPNLQVLHVLGQIHARLVRFLTPTHFDQQAFLAERTSR